MAENNQSDGHNFQDEIKRRESLDENKWNGLTLDRIFHPPCWSNKLKEAKFSNLREFEERLMKWECILQQELIKYDYNTYNSFRKFYKSFVESKEDILDFILSYQTDLSTNSMSCVEMSLFLMNILIQEDKKYGRLFSLISCEEIFIESRTVIEGVLDKNSQLDTEVLIEHVLVGLKFELSEEKRSGFVLFDLGYHIARPIVVMSDTLYPHTGWFTASNNGKVKRERCHQIINDKYIACKVRESKSNLSLKEMANLIYIEKEFTRKDYATEIRSLIFKMKSFVVRNRKGAVSGIYSFISTKNVNVFYEENGERTTKKFHIADFDKQEFRDSLVKVVAAKENVLSIEDTVDDLVEMMRNYRDTIEDEDFCSDLVDIDDWIEGD